MRISLTQIKRPTGYIVYEGPSQLNGKPIVVIATLESANEKTGNMIQTFILCADKSPIDAVMGGTDNSICGDCRHRGINGKGRTCYVNIATSPTQVYNKYRTGGYPKLTDYSIFNGRKVRLGSYGCPSAVPLNILEEIVKNSSGHTCYIHSWKIVDPSYARVAMASVDNVRERRQAKKLGYRTFRVRKADYAVNSNEFECPASPNGGATRQCIDCMACGGTRMGRLGAKAADVTIVVHGRMSHKFQRA